ncbi:MAG: hypothetical protein JXR73_03475 [Candidatus Omnitrophica bacterium]|nr:hypothetical protein [Candidatus Omnitrophota bacterium]
MRKIITLFILVFLFSVSPLAKELPDIRSVQTDLIPPPMTNDAPAAGKRVKQTAQGFEGTDIHHSLYLPMDWRKEGRCPVIVEYAGNGPYANEYGDICTGKVEDCKLGYGISRGEGFIWICLPYISKDHARNQLQWWGDVEATVEYCINVVPQICLDYGGDSSKVLLAGFSRGSIACNYIGLHDDKIASLWRGFICHSHYDGVRIWDYEDSDRKSAMERLKRLKNRPQFISHEVTVDEVRNYLTDAHPEGRFTFLPLPYRNHTDAWVLRDIPERKRLREWVRKVLAE